MNRASAWGIALVLVGAVMPVASARAADSTVYQVTIERDSFAFTPQALSIHQGDRIRWTNNDGQMHMIVTTKPDSNKELELYQRVNPGESFDHQFTTVAAYYYYCAIHFQMWGIISVNP
jgi:plastocyanin